MIQLSVDEALAYDMLSILSIKSQTKPEVRPDWDRMVVEIIQQVGQERHDLIMAQAYPVLWATNSAIFNRIDDLKKSDEPIEAREIDALNYRRFEIKQQLQKQFFPDKPLTEQKLGYPS